MATPTKMTPEARLLNRVRTGKLPFTKRNFNLIYELALREYRFKQELDAAGYQLPDPGETMAKRRQSLQNWLTNYVLHHHSAPREKTEEEVREICNSILANMMEEED